MYILRSLIFAFLFSFTPFYILAQCDDIDVAISSNTGAYAEEMSWKLFDENGQVLASFQGFANNSQHDTTLCLTNGCYLLKAKDSYGDGWNGGFVIISFIDTLLEFKMASGSNMNFYFGINEENCAPIVPGCTDPESLNYDPDATVDDGSCQSFQEVLGKQIIDTIHYGGSKDNRINWVIQNRGSSFANRDEFLQLFEDDLFRSFTVGDDQEVPPYGQYRDFFNLYAVWWPDAPSDQEWWHFNIIKRLRDEIFLPWANDETGWVTWFSTTRHGGGGGAGRDRDARVGDGKMYGMGYETFLHEFSHTMPGIPDEYTSSGVWSGGQCWESGNTTGFTTWEEIPWRLWIEKDTPIPTPYEEEYLDKIGVFEGALTNFFGCYRPTARNCFMGAGGFGEGYGQKLCPVCQQRTLCYLYKYVNVIENYFPNEPTIELSGSETVHFSADVLHPEPNTQKYEWFLNGKLIAEGVKELDLVFDKCDKYTLVFAVTDTNSLLRYDPKFEDTYPKPYREVTWTITQTDINDYDLQAVTTLSNPDCTGEINGKIDFNIEGGIAPYSIHQNGQAMENPVTGLSAGTYEFDIVDANGCGISKSLELIQESVLDPIISSEFVDGKWNLLVELEQYDINTVDLLWSTGAISPMITALTDGNYSVQITTDSGCSVEESISLIHVSSDLEVEPLVLASGIEENNGKIYLDVAGGITPYSIRWQEKVNSDITDTNTANIEASGTTWGHLPEYAFDNDINTKWLHFVSENAWITHYKEGGSVVNYYTITSGDDVPDRDPKDWLFQGSNDGINWVNLDEQYNQNFSSRFEKRAYMLDNYNSYAYYRFYVTKNHGDGSIQLQELEFIGTSNFDLFFENVEAEDLLKRSMLTPGAYVYTLKDANYTVKSDTLFVGYADRFIADGLDVVQQDRCSVAIEGADAEYHYYWLADEDADEILHMGPSFQPPATGNYYVAKVDPLTMAMSDNRKGFAVILDEMPEIEITEENKLAIIDPDPDMDYLWYDTDASCQSPIHQGTEYIPEFGTGFYFVSAINNLPKVDPVDPSSVPGILIRIDASDLNGDGLVDDPAPASSSTYDWQFENGNKWSDGSWFAYRGNHQNGLGVADFATIWLQGIAEPVTGYQTIMMAYEEDPLSFSGTAPFKGLAKDIPRHNDESQLFSDNAPDHTLNGSTFLNGFEVDPLTTSNPLEFCILAARMTGISGNTIRNTDTHWEGKVGEIILFDHALSDDQIEGISEYLRKKWISMADLESPRKSIFWESPSNAVGIKNSQINFYPNPASDKIRIEGLNGNEEIHLIAPDGSVRYSANNYAKNMIIDISNLYKGLYVLVVRDKEGEILVSKKLVKEGRN